MISLRTPEEIEAIGRAGGILARLFDELRDKVHPGVSTAELDAFAEEFVRAQPGAEPAFKGLYGFPATLCTSVDEQVVHGIPSGDVELADGSIVSIDAGVRLEGWYADAAVTLPVGEIDDATRRLLDTTEAALRRGIAHAAEGNRMGDIGHAIQKTAEDAGYHIVRDLVGHGVGREPHEDPQVPNTGRPGRGLKLRSGLVIAIEPMVTAGAPDIRTLDDRWTVVTTDSTPSAHFEHTVAILDTGPRALTAL